MSGRIGGWARFGLPGVALGMLMSWGAGFHGEPACGPAQDAPGRPGPGVPAPAGEARRSRRRPRKGVASGEAGGILALITNPTSISPVQWLYLIDTKKRSFAIYRVDPANPQGCVKLEASRQFRWDLDLDEYNNQGLEPADVKARVEALNRSNP